uniref:TSP1_CCN domain-containing protein n=1 Tax=Macrostomum lignano TaxID=282301 RepID=A0A1I8GQJ9_9PLAT
MQPQNHHHQGSGSLNEHEKSSNLTSTPVITKSSVDKVPVIVVLMGSLIMLIFLLVNVPCIVLQRGLFCVTGNSSRFEWTPWGNCSATCSEQTGIQIRRLDQLGALDAVPREPVDKANLSHSTVSKFHNNKNSECVALSGEILSYKKLQTLTNCDLFNMI